MRRIRGLMAGVAMLASAACAADSVAGPEMSPRLSAGKWEKPDRPPDILLRGPKAIRVLEVKQAPLWVVDGVRYAESPHGLDSSSVVSIEVLKGDAATALYGTEAAHGVIIVTTRGEGTR